MEQRLPNFELQKNYEYDYYISNFNWISTDKKPFYSNFKNLSILIPIIFITKILYQNRFKHFTEKIY